MYIRASNAQLYCPPWLCTYSTQLQMNNSTGRQPAHPSTLTLAVDHACAVNIVMCDHNNCYNIIHTCIYNSKITCIYISIMTVQPWWGLVDVCSLKNT